MKDLEPWAKQWEKMITGYPAGFGNLVSAVRAIMTVVVELNREIEALKKERQDAL